MSYELVNTDLPITLADYQKNGLHLWKDSSHGFDLYIFSIYLTTGELNQKWKQIRDDIALHFQATLQKEIERWNIYIFYFTDKPISDELKYAIENDHYCARKLVFDYLKFSKDITSEDMQKVICDRLFELNVEPFDGDESKLFQLEKEIQRINPDLTDLKFINEIIVKYKGGMDE